MAIIRGVGPKNGQTAIATTITSPLVFKKAVTTLRGSNALKLQNHTF